MKKSVILGLALLAAGALMFALGFFGSGKNLSAVNGDLGPISVRAGRRGFGSGKMEELSYNERRYTLSSAGIKKIVLSEDNADVTVVATGSRPNSSSGDIVLTYQESADEALEITNQNGVLTIKRRGRVGFFFFWFPDTDLHTELRIPRGMTVELSVESDNGAIAAEGLFLRGDAALSGDNGSITVDGLRAEHLTLKSSNGRIEAADVDCAALEVTNSNGRVTLSDVAAETTLYAETSNGAVSVENLSAGRSIELRSSNGSVKGTLAGGSEDYRIESKTDNGSNNLPDHWGKGEILLRVRTSNGSIDLRFNEDSY